MLTVRQIACRVARLNQLANCLEREARRLRCPIFPLRGSERGAYLAGLENAVCGLRTAQEALDLALHRQVGDELAAKQGRN